MWLTILKDDIVRCMLFIFYEILFVEWLTLKFHVQIDNDKCQFMYDKPT